MAVESPDGALNIRVALAGEGAGGRAKTVEPASAAYDLPPPTVYRYALWRENGLWELWYEGRHATLKHEQGLFYVAHALGHPEEPLKKLALATLYASFGHRQPGITGAWDAHRGQVVPLGKEPVVQRPVAREDDAEARRRLEKLARVLRARLADATALDAEKAEARQQLGEIASFLRRDTRLSRDEYKKAADSVRSALKRLLGTLLKPGGSATSPSDVRRVFAEHLERHLLIPSSRYSDPKARQAAGERAGCLIYEPPAGVRWSPCRVTPASEPEPFPGQASNTGSRNT